MKKYLKISLTIIILLLFCSQSITVWAKNEPNSISKKATDLDENLETLLEVNLD